MDDLLFILDRAYDRQSWHGTNLRGSIRGLTPAAATWRPAKNRHNIWEIVVHAAYWKYAVCGACPGRSGVFPAQGLELVRPPEASRDVQRAWRADVALLDRMHAELRKAIAALPARELHVTPLGSKISNFAIIAGIAAHDLYHAGQIQLLKKLAR